MADANSGWFHSSGVDDVDGPARRRGHGVGRSQWLFRCGAEMASRNGCRCGDADRCTSPQMLLPSCKPLPRSGMAAGGSPAGINRSAGLRLQSVEQRFRVGVVVADPWSGERPEHTKLLQSGFQRGCPLSLRGSLRLGHCRCRHGGSVDHQIEVEPDTTDAGGQEGDVPTLHTSLGPLASSRGTGRGCWGGRARSRRCTWLWIWRTR